MNLAAGKIAETHHHLTKLNDCALGFCEALESQCFLQFVLCEEPFLHGEFAEEYILLLLTRVRIDFLEIGLLDFENMLELSLREISAFQEHGA